MVDVAQLVRALVCGTKGRGFESHLPPGIGRKSASTVSERIFLYIWLLIFTDEENLRYHDGQE